jgi:hypothetical protein
LAAQLKDEYPDYWPETIRALIVHSARWTKPMEQRFNDKPDSEAAKCRLRCYGHGVPSITRAMHSASHRPTLIIEDRIQPFEYDKDNYYARSGDMNLHQLPWPSQLLTNYGRLEVRLRITLSYFVEPNPASRGPINRYRYPSHLLRFDVQKPAEGESEFRRRINKAERGEDGAPDTESDSGEWKLGKEARSGGSIHSDVWEGTAAQLAGRKHIGIMPKTGWWKEYTSQERFDSIARYSLIVSIETDETEVEVAGETQPVELYEPLKQKITPSQIIET